MSENRKMIKFRTLSGAFLFQIIFALFIFTFPSGTAFFLKLNGAVIRILEAASEGSRFLFGALALPPGSESADGSASLGFFFAFQALPTIILFSGLMSCLYFLGIMQRVINLFAVIFKKLMKLSGAESVAASSNLFVGIESATTILPYLNNMTRSEFAALLSCGMATVASNVLAVYVFTLQSTFPTIAGHLISATFLSVPAALMMSKILIPETETPETADASPQAAGSEHKGFFEALIKGSESGVKLIVGIAGLLVAVLGMVAIFNLLLGSVGHRINDICGLTVEWKIESLLGYLFYPFIIMIGIPLEDAGLAAKIIGERIILTEVTSYIHLAEALKSGALTNPRSAAVIAYTLCGFAHLASMSIFVGGISALAPKRIQTITSVGIKALIASTLACLYTGAMAGTLISSSSIILTN